MMRTRTNDAAVALVGEVADVLRANAEIACVPTIAEDDGLWTLALTFRAGDDPTRALRILEMATALKRVADVAQMRGFAEIYDIAPEKLEALICGEDKSVSIAFVQPRVVVENRVDAIAAAVAERYTSLLCFAGGGLLRDVVRFVVERLEARDAG